MKVLLFGGLLALLTACSREPEEATSTLYLSVPGAMATRSEDPDETLITDYNLFLFNSLDILEEQVFVSGRKLVLENGQLCHHTRLLKEQRYTVFVAANLGYALEGIGSIEELLECRYYLAYPDEFTPGMPMSAHGTIVGGASAAIPLQRLMARVDLRIDRSQLQADVTLTAEEVRVGACPASARLFGESKIGAADQAFAQGFSKSGTQVAPLNRSSAEEENLSGAVSLYLLENLQGDLLDGCEADADKLLTDSPFRNICSYIELRAGYHSASAHTRPGEQLIYRFYLGESLDNFDVRRNVRYRITLCPIGTGLGESSWRVDQSALEWAEN